MNYASDATRQVTFEAADGSTTTISQAAAKQSVTLGNIICDCPHASTVPLYNIANQEELELLTKVLTIADSEEQDKTTILRSLISRDTELPLLCINNFFDIPEFTHAITQEFAALLAMIQKTAPYKKKILTLSKVKELLQKNVDRVDTDDADKNIHIAINYLLNNIIADAEKSAKKRFLESKGEVRDPYFSGASIGELAAHDLAEYEHTPSVYVNACALVVKPPLSLPDIVSFSGLPYTDNSILRINNTNTTIIEETIFDNLTQLRYLDLEYNALQAIPEP